MTNGIIIDIERFFSEIEQQILAIFLAKKNWTLNNSSGYNYKESDRIFWAAPLTNPACIDFFYKKIKSGLKREIKIISIIVNGQAHGQCGSWHPDINDVEDAQQYFTLVYFPYAWMPEYGGHLVIQKDKFISILPELNKAVIFSSHLFHVGLEPTTHCKTQRVSIACKFKVLD